MNPNRVTPTVSPYWVTGVQDDVPCKQCGGEGIPLGSLGTRQWFRCRDCGWTYSDSKEGA